MLNKFKNFVLNISEEIKYQDNIVFHKKSLETTLWGLEEQTKFPENSKKEDLQTLSEEINNCRQKINNCDRLIEAHNSKVISLINDFNSNINNLNEPCDGCGGNK